MAIRGPKFVGINHEGQAEVSGSWYLYSHKTWVLGQLLLLIMSIYKHISIYEPGSWSDAKYHGGSGLFDNKKPSNKESIQYLNQIRRHEWENEVLEKGKSPPGQSRQYNYDHLK